MAGLLPDQAESQGFGGILGLLAMLYHSGLLNSLNPIGTAQAAEDPRNSKLGMGPMVEPGPSGPGSGGVGGGGISQPEASPRFQIVRWNAKGIPEAFGDPISDYHEANAQFRTVQQQNPSDRFAIGPARADTTVVPSTGPAGGLSEFKPNVGQDAFNEGYRWAYRGQGRRTGIYDQANYDRGFFAGRDDWQAGKPFQPPSSQPGSGGNE